MPDVFHFNFLLDRATVSGEPHTQKEKKMCRRGGNYLTLSKSYAMNLAKKKNKQDWISPFVFLKNKSGLCIVNNDD